MITLSNALIPAMEMSEKTIENFDEKDFRIIKSYLEALNSERLKATFQDTFIKIACLSGPDVLRHIDFWDNTVPKSIRFYPDNVVKIYELIKNKIGLHDMQNKAVFGWIESLEGCRIYDCDFIGSSVTSLVSAERCLFKQKNLPGKKAMIVCLSLREGIAPGTAKDTQEHGGLINTISLINSTLFASLGAELDISSVLGSVSNGNVPKSSRNIRAYVKSPQCYLIKHGRIEQLYIDYYSEKSPMVNVVFIYE